MLKSGVFILLVLATKTSLAQLDSDALCCNSVPCKCVDTLPITICQGVSLSPYYTVAATKSPSTKNLDSVCSTYFAVDECTYLTFVVTTFSDGSTQISVFFSSQFPNQKGAVRVEGNINESGGGSIVFNQFYYGEPCENVFVAYTCYLFGGCSTLQAQQQYGDQRTAVSTSPYISPFCFWRIKTLDKTRFSDTEWLQYPYNLNPSCVASFNGADCINNDRIPEAYKISVPNLADATVQNTLATALSPEIRALDEIYNGLGPTSTLDQVDAATADISNTITRLLAT